MKHELAKQEIMNISQRLERLPMTPTMNKILLVVGIGWLFDAMDQGMVSGVLAAVGSDWTLSPLIKVCLQVQAPLA
mgnify:CR=1 FL=1